MFYSFSLALCLANSRLPFPVWNKRKEGNEEGMEGRKRRKKEVISRHAMFPTNVDFLLLFL